MTHVTRPAARFRAALLLFWAAAFVWAAAFAPPASAQAGNVIDANAKLHVTVANQAQLTGDYTVDSAGNITMLYINQVHVQGLTPAQAADVIRGVSASGGQKATGLSQFYVRPQVVVSIQDAGGIGVDVTGLVSAPRHYVVRSDARLNDVLQQAVPALNADLTKVEVGHIGSSAKEMVDYRSYLDNKADAGNPPLHDGDMINIASHEPLPIFINIQGQVGKPGRFQIPAGSTAYSAIQLAGGPTLTANTAEIILKHFGAGPTDTTSFNFGQAGQNPTDVSVNPVLLDGDTIIVPAAPISATYTLTGPGIMRPSEYALPNGQPITLQNAIGLAGGLTDRAKIDDVEIIRTNPGAKTAQTIKLKASDPNVRGSYMVQAGDNITIGQGSPPSRVDPLSLIGIAVTLFGLLGHR